MREYRSRGKFIIRVADWRTAEEKKKYSVIIKCTDRSIKYFGESGNLPIRAYHGFATDGAHLGRALKWAKAQYNLMFPTVVLPHYLPKCIHCTYTIRLMRADHEAFNVQEDTDMESTDSFLKGIIKPRKYRFYLRDFFTNRLTEIKVTYYGQYTHGYNVVSGGWSLYKYDDTDIRAIFLQIRYKGRRKMSMLNINKIESIKRHWIDIETFKGKGKNYRRP